MRREQCYVHQPRRRAQRLRRGRVLRPRRLDTGGPGWAVHASKWQRDRPEPVHQGVVFDGCKWMVDGPGLVPSDRQRVRSRLPCRVEPRVELWCGHLRRLSGHPHLPAPASAPHPANVQAHSVHPGRPVHNAPDAAGVPYACHERRLLHDQLFPQLGRSAWMLQVHTPDTQHRRLVPQQQPGWQPPVRFYG